MNAQFPRDPGPARASAPAPAAMRVLVTGASGAVGSLLAPRLVIGGHTVRAFGRDPGRIEEALDGQLLEAEADEVEIVQGDVVTGAGLARALKAVDVAYYLMHSMERSAADPSPFTERERLAAENFAAAAARAGVGRIVYLGGLVPRQDTADGLHRRSRHLASREAVERILLAAVPDSVALRASIVIGERSRSFRFLVRLVERMPVLTLPAWHSFRTQPIDARDITEMLAAASTAEVSGRSLDVGGPDILTYGEMITTIADVLLVNRPSLRFGVSATPLAARVAAAIAREDPELVMPLMEGLQGDLLVPDDEAARLLGVELHSFVSAVERALGEWEDYEPLRAR
ncbi:MAG TPA: NAD(P)H-binding protein [Solirubrobacteraceae bacterium]|nr:NAD(P)H-binding protein [Solirubrobacteraceae bacterium]